MKTVMKSVVLVGVLSLAGCGGGGGGGNVEDNDRNLPEPRPAASLSGYGFDGLIIDGDVKVHDFTGGNKGALLGSGKTNGQGFYEVTLSTSDKPVLIVVDGGYYLEEASGVQVQVDKSKGLKMMAVEYYESGKAIDVSATFFTNIATGYFQYLVKNQGLREDVAVERAYAAVDAWAGFDTRRTHPVDVSSFANATPYMTDSHRYGFVAAGASTTSLEVGNESGGGVHDLYTSITFNQLAYEDVAYDGLLDGNGPSGRLAFGNRLLNSNSYRDKLALSMLRFAISDRNATGMSFDDLLPFASHLNQDAGDLFGGVVAPDITTIQPVITQFVPANGVTMRGTYPVSVLVSDPTGIETIHFYVGDRYVTAASPRNGQADIDTLNFTNGSYVLRVEVTNFMGRTVSLTRNIMINNGQLAISLPGAWRDWMSSQDNYNRANCPFNFGLHDSTGFGAKIVKLNESILLQETDIPGGSMVVPSSVGFSNVTNNLSNSHSRGSHCQVVTVTAHDRLNSTYRWDVAITRQHEMVDAGKFRVDCSYRFASAC